ncbi:hypothetical protein PybrP1_004447 [[Pythium] brassicae (nom. inval.)]|nr:hypothetical protein PybrP1_004447 [[Pythium] brassicae (nom. inval.)]
MGSEMGDQTHEALAKGMTAPGTQGAVARTAPAPVTTSTHPAAAARDDTGAQERTRWPLPVSRILQRGSLAPVDKDTHNRTHNVSATEGDSDDGVVTSSQRAVCSSSSPQDAAVELAMALLRKLQQDASSVGGAIVPALSTTAATVAVTKEEVDQILAGFAKALESSASSGERGIEDEMQRLFVSHANVFDEDMQSFFIQNFIHEAECAKTFRAAVRRTSLVRRCLVAMYPTDDRSTASAEADKPRRWSASLVARAVRQHHTRSNSLEVCPEVVNPAVIDTVERQIAQLSSWDFDVFAIADAVPGQTLSIVGNALLEKIELKYHDHPYHNAVHAADVAQSLYHFLSSGGVGDSCSPRTKCTAILAAIVHDVGHTSYSNNFHIAVNDDLAIQYVYRSPLEHMHCALAFQVLKNSKFNVLQGLTKIEQLEVRNLVTDMVLATDNAVHSTYLAKLEALVGRSSDDGWRLCDPDDEKLVLQMVLHAADVSNPAKSIDLCKKWADKIMVEFYQQGDKERELQLPVSVGYDRDSPIPLEKMQAGFIIGIVRPLFHAMAQLPRARLGHCMQHLDGNLRFWQSELVRNQSSPPSPLLQASAPADNTIAS